MNTDYDVIIVGAGPSGSTCAKILSDNKIKSLIIEKRSIPRYKACGGLLSPKSIEVIKEIFGDIPDNIKCNNSKINTVISKNGNRFVPLRDPVQLKVFRKDLDQWLVKSSGSEIIDQVYYFNHSIKDNIISVEIIKNGIKKTITCKFLVGADGGSSKVRKNIDPNKDKAKWGISKQLVIEGTSILDDHLYYFFVNPMYSDYFSWFNKENNLIYLGSFYLLNNKNNKYIENLISLLKENFKLKINNIIRKEICVGDARPNETRFFFGKDNVLIIGEASGLVYRLGEGLPSAFISGKLGAKAIINSMQNNKNAYDNYIDNILKEKEYAKNKSL